MSSRTKDATIRAVNFTTATIRTFKSIHNNGDMVEKAKRGMSDSVTSIKLQQAGLLKLIMPVTFTSNVFKNPYIFS